VPRCVHQRAREVLDWLESQHHAAIHSVESSASVVGTHFPAPQTRLINGHGNSTSARWQMTLFGLEEHPLLEEIRAIRVDELSPLQAFELLREWHQRLVGEACETKR
jgi:hypothetical protein